MLNPISLNVIRQALAWHGLPKPVAIFRGGRSVNDHGVVALNYFLHFDPAALPTIMAEWSLRDGMDMPELAERVRDCFCDDIQVIAAYYSIDVNRVICHIMVLPFVAEVF